MSNKERITFTNLGLRMLGFGSNDEVAESVIELGKLLDRKGGKADLRDITELQHRMKEKYRPSKKRKP